MSQNPTKICLSIASVPVLIGIVAVRRTLESLQAVGIASEELFRGSRLPVLHFPVSNPNRD